MDRTRALAGSRPREFDDVTNVPTYKVLLVDDDTAMLRLLSSIMRKAGYEVRLASDGMQALAQVELDCPDIVITDWEMPGMSGLELCRQLRQIERNHYLYVVFLTAKTGSEAMIEALATGANDFLSKPIGPGELLARMQAGGRVLELERRLTQLAGTDPLTGVPTRRHFYDQLVREFERARRYHLPLSCVMLDVDYFKRVNDTYGHPAGDAVLKAVGRLLAVSCRASDRICRYGGEEFCALLPETTEAGALIWADRIRQAIGTLKLPVNGATFGITVSLGVAQQIDSTRTPEEMVDQADQALLVAKQSGRDRVVGFAGLDETSQVNVDALRNSANPLNDVLARDIMLSPVVCLNEEDTVANVAEFLCQLRINSTPVVNREGRLTGIVSEKDVMAVMLSPEAWAQPIRTIMKTNVICYPESTPVCRIHEFLCRVSIRRVIIVRDGQPVGSISRFSLLRWFNTWMQLTGRQPIDGSLPIESTYDVRAREHTRDAAQELIVQATELHRHIEPETDPSMPVLMNRISRMQDLLGDLLNFSRAVTETSPEEMAGLPVQ
jgi:two-component system cell cycle response regulator